MDLVSFVSARFSQGPPPGNLLHCCLRALFRAPVVPCCGIVSRALLGDFVTSFTWDRLFGLLNILHAGPFTLSANSTNHATFLTLILFVLYSIIYSYLVCVS